jgi:TonB family protein
MRIFTAAVGILLVASLAIAQTPLYSLPRLAGGGVPPPAAPTVIGGGEVVLELSVGRTGAVEKVTPIRSTSPYTELLTAAASRWQFAAATTLLNKQPVPTAATVLVVGVFRPPSLVVGANSGTPPKTVGVPSRGAPQVASVVFPNYSPNMTGDATLLVEVELTTKGEARGHRVIAGAAGFDAAALDAVRQWRFVPGAGPDPQFVYAVVGFRTPIAARD